MNSLPETGLNAETTLTALLGAVLAECARDPLSFLAGESRGSALIRIGRGSTRAREPDRFDDLLLEAFDSVSDVLLAWTTRQIGSRTDAEDIVQTALMRVYAARPDVDTADRLRGYLWTVTKNLVRDAWRRAATDRERFDSDGDERIALLADRAGLHVDDIVVLRQALIGALTLCRRASGRPSCSVPTKAIPTRKPRASWASPRAPRRATCTTPCSGYGSDST